MTAAFTERTSGVRLCPVIELNPMSFGYSPELDHGPWTVEHSTDEYTCQNPSGMLGRRTSFGPSRLGGVHMSCRHEIRT